jgi:predicted nucleic acid-binding protein
VIVLDTMVVLEPARRHPDQSAIAWLDAQDPGELWLTAITAAELQAGVEKQTDGGIRAIMQAAVRAILEDEFAGRVLSFDLDAALVYARIAGRLERARRRIDALDFQIAAIARAHGAAVATRNVQHFEDCGVALIDPWAG